VLSLIFCVRHIALPCFSLKAGTKVVGDFILCKSSTKKISFFLSFRQIHATYTTRSNIQDATSAKISVVQANKTAFNRKNDSFYGLA